MSRFPLPFPFSLRCRPRPLDDRGQATSEYALVILVAGTVALTVLSWAKASGTITGLFDGVVSRLTGGI